MSANTSVFRSSSSGFLTIAKVCVPSSFTRDFHASTSALVSGSGVKAGLREGVASACHTGTNQSPIIATLNAHEIHRDEFDRFLELKMGEFDTADLSNSIRSQM